MDKNLQNIDDLFKAALEDDEENPSPKVWNNIHHVLDKDNLVRIRKKYNSLKKIVALLLFLLICFSIYEFSKTSTAVLNKQRGATVKNEIPKSTNDKTLAEKNYGIFKKQPGTGGISDLINGNTVTANNYNDLTNPGKNISTNSFDVIHPRILHNNSDYKMNLKTSEAVKDELQLKNNDDKQMNIQLQYSEPLNDLPVETISRTIDSIKFRSSLTLNKTVSAADAKNTQGKNKKLKDTKSSRFSVTPFFSPDFASYHLEDDFPDNQPDNANTFKKKESHDPSSTFGALVDYKLAKRWSLQSGITFSTTNIIVDPKTIYAQADNAGKIKYRINTSSGYGFVLPTFNNNPTVGDSLYAFTSTHNLQYISIPLAIKYNRVIGKFKFNALAGASVNYLIVGKIETLVEKGTNNEVEILDNLQGLKKIYFSGLAGMGMEYSFNKKVALIFSPTIRFALNPINKNAPVKSYPNYFGLSAGIKIGL